MMTHDVDVAKLVEPKVVRDVGGLHEVTLRQLLVDLGSGKVELVQDPLLDERLLPVRLQIRSELDPE